MSSGTPDYSLATKTDIVAQTLSQMDINIIAQTLTNLDIDINAQSIDEIINRPKYGAMQISDYVNIAFPVGWTTLFEISAQGMVYGGFVASANDVSHKDDIVRVTVDNTIVFQLPFSSLINTGQDAPDMTFCRLMRYDDTDFDYGVGIRPNFTFESGFNVAYDNNEADTTWVVSHIFYATI